MALAKATGGQVREAQLIASVSRHANQVNKARIALQESFDKLDDARMTGLDDAIAEINGAGANLLLERVYEGTPEIPIYLLETPEGGRMAGTSNGEIDGQTLSIGRVALRTRGGEIRAAAIAISRDIRRREVASVMLEELVQAMGLPTDVRSPAYRRSIFSEEGNSVVWLRGQDAEALRRHYPHFRH